MKKLVWALLALAWLIPGVASAQNYPCPLAIQPRLVSTSTYTVTTADMCWLIIFTEPGPVTVKLPSPGLIFPPTFKTTLLPINGATITMTGLPDDAGRIHHVNGQTVLTLLQGSGAMMQIEQDYNWYALPTAGVSFPTIPSASLLGGVDGAFSGVAVGSGLSLSGGIISRNPMACADLTDGGTACPEDVGTLGHKLPFLDGGNLWSGPGNEAQTFTSVFGTSRTVSGTTDTLSASDCGKAIIYTSGSTVTVTTFANVVSGTSTCSIAILQQGAGPVQIADGSGATHVSSHSCTQTFGQYATMGLFVHPDAPSEFNIMGDCSP